MAGVAAIQTLRNPPYSNERATAAAAATPLIHTWKQSKPIREMQKKPACGTLPKPAKQEARRKRRENPQSEETSLRQNSDYLPIGEDNGRNQETRIGMDVEIPEKREQSGLSGQ
ncbi:hypothetical protein TIFTF001_017497 [Ficus carica]|uniref:Uncharacterized protein n=1 Tax=Ficus carica TaxID=3494 RepID=A0AA88ALA3_FICCA|nr:hypothetical protein TIFTF001_017497 [Ficus carica]